MSTAAQPETLGFQTETRQLLELMARALYSNREIFLRELISNASDAADRLRFAALEDDGLYEGDAELKIRVEYNKTQRTISVIDNGIGMSRAQAVEDLGTIARSGSKQFFASLSGDARQDSQLIGQFGVGFYSAFVVARKVEVLSRRAGLARAEGVCWTSSGESEFSVATVSRPRRGTRVNLYLREDMDEFLDGERLRAIIRKYSDHISLPIVMLGEAKDSPGEETVNNTQALWRRNRKELTDKDYQEFYKHVTHDFADPLAWSHNRVEGKLEYASVLFIPAQAPFDLWDREARRGVKLYVRRVFIMDEAEQLLPTWLRFVKGVVDCDDLPLNVSRELLQQNRTISAIRAGCTLRILGLLEDMAKNDPERYTTFWGLFGKVLKEGVMDPGEHKGTLLDLLRFTSTHDEGQQVSLADYTGRMPDWQKAIYYITADSRDAARNSPHLEIFINRGIEVLLWTDAVDEWLALHLEEYQEKPLLSVSKGKIDLADLQGQEDRGQDQDEGQSREPDHAVSADCTAAIQRMQEVLGERVKSVRATARLTDSPVCLVVEENEMGRRMEQFLRASGQPVATGKPILEVNPHHPIMVRLFGEPDAEHFAEWCRVLFDQALLSEGSPLPDPVAFVKRLNALFLTLTETRSGGSPAAD